MMRFPRWWQARFLLYEWIAALALTLAVASLSEYFSQGAFIESVVEKNRATIYGTLATTFGALLGFAIAAISIIISYAENQRLERLREDKDYATLWLIFTSTIRWSGIASLMALAALIADRDGAALRWMTYAVLFTSLAATFRTIRTIWIIENVVRIVTAHVPGRKVPEPPAPGHF
jgi:type IV secretory pathway VirB2 component (pilin)